jgi:hypothetical protein
MDIYRKIIYPDRYPQLFIIFTQGLTSGWMLLFSKPLLKNFNIIQSKMQIYKERGFFTIFLPFAQADCINL